VAVKPTARKGYTQAHVDRIGFYKTHPFEWFKDLFGDNVYKLQQARGSITADGMWRETGAPADSSGLTGQQINALQEWGILIGCKLLLAAGKDLTEAQARWADKVGMSIQSANGCHAWGTPVLMHDGEIRRVEDVRVGDLIMGDDSTPRRVLSLARGRERMYRIRYKNGEFYDVNESHILSLRCISNHARKYVKGQLLDISVRDYLKLNTTEKTMFKGYKAPVEFPEKTLPIPPYILGMWLGDGCFSAPEMTSIDPEIISEWNDWGISLGLTMKRRSYKAWRVTNGHCGGAKNAWMELLKEGGLFRNKHIPDVYLKSSRAQRLELLAGLIDTDGSLDKRKGRVYSIIQKDEALAGQIRWLARSLGMHSTISKKEKSWTYNGTRNVGVYHEVHIARKVEEIPCRVARKKAAKIPNGMELNFGFDVIPMEIDDYYGFELNGNHRYLIGDFTVTHNTGKDFTAAIVTWHFMFCFSYPKVIATANTGKQLNEVYWSELAKVRGLARKADPSDPNSVSDLQANFTMQAEMLFANLPNKEERGKRHFCVPVTINTKATAEQQGEALAGRHEDHMLFVIDEASGIPDAVFKPIEKTLTGKLNLVFMIFNPTQNLGFAIRSQVEQRSKWVCKHWSGLDSENVSRASIRNLAVYGKDSPDYRIGVLGLPPLADSNGLIPYLWIQAAIGREFDNDNDPVMASADVGGGGDKSVFCYRQGGVVQGFKTNNSKNTMDVADWVVEACDDADAAVCFVDIIGLGRGVYDRARQLRRIVRPADARNTASNEEKYFNARAEGYHTLRKQFEQGTISIPAPGDSRDANDPIVRLIRELGAIKNETVGKKDKIGDKKEIRKLIGFSPDYADALMMTFWKPDSLFRKVVSGQKHKAVDFKGVYLR
jgi:hypothetical protein